MRSSEVSAGGPDAGLFGGEPVFLRAREKEKSARHMLNVLEPSTHAKVQVSRDLVM